MANTNNNQGNIELINPIFKPTIRMISAITRGYPTIITTDIAHNYISGIYIRILVPTATDKAIYPAGPVGMRQINGLSSEITVTGTTTFTMDLDSTHFDPFVLPSPWDSSISLFPQAIPFAEDNSMLTGAVQNTLNPQV